MNPNKIGSVASTYTPVVICSTISPDLCVTLAKSNPGTSANFTTSYAYGCDRADCPGEWITILGAFVSTSGEGDIPFKVVDCRVRYGTISIRQIGTGTPELDRSSFEMSTESWNSYPTGAWRRIYNEVKWDQTIRSIQNPYAFGSLVTATGWEGIYAHPVGALLLGTEQVESAATVARRIERNFDMATLFAYAREPTAAVQTVTRVDERRRWHYEPLFLLVLLVPALATLAAVLGRWKVTGDDIFIGYNPVEIAIRGPITGVSDARFVSVNEGTKYS